ETAPDDGTVAGAVSRGGGGDYAADASAASLEARSAASFSAATRSAVAVSAARVISACASRMIPWVDSRKESRRDRLISL
ncbi:MAG TPA: hypothetical protein VM899_12790, partial [Rubellimicrobium sp.]|nr:hypothetical protein [Rubellimicrobium sp.]